MLLGVGAGSGWAGARSAAADPALTGHTPSLNTATIERRAVGATVLATGVVRARVGAQVAVGSRASGVLQKLHVTVGDRVRPGQLLAELDPTEFNTMVERAEAVRLNAVAERTWAEGELQRIAQLAERGASTIVELSQATRAAESARAREREANAALQAARVQLGYGSIRAPIGGVVGSVSTQEGETVAASFAAPTFVTIVDLGRLEVWAYVDETDIGRIRVGQPARFTVDTYPDEEFEGRVSAIRPTAEIRDNVVNYITLIEFTNRTDRLLRPEMTTSVNIVIDGKADVVAVPNAALRRDAAGSFVLVPGESGLVRRDLRVGFRGTDFSEVLSGLEPGARVALGPALCEAQPAGETR